jgi:F0F1-type ATP synthase membrane subunit b/b'
MRRLLLLFSLLAGLCAAGLTPHLAAQSNESASQRVADEEESGTQKWKLLNTAIFVLILGYGVIRTAPSFFNARSLDIQKAIKDATGLKIEADFRHSEADKKMANLGNAVAVLRAQAKAEMERQHQRILQETEVELTHIRHNLEAELEWLQTDGERQVRQHTARLAIGLAERRLQGYFAEGHDTGNIRDFVNLVERGNN